MQTLKVLTIKNWPKRTLKVKNSKNIPIQKYWKLIKAQELNYANLEGSYYHIYNRGAHKSKIFFDDKDYLFFLKRLGQYKKKYRIYVLSYVLMPNHFHLFVMVKSEENHVGKFLSDLTNSYTKAFNKRHEHSGVVFQGPTKRKHIENEEHLLWITKYILLNPVLANLVVHPQDWKYSSAKTCLLNDRDSLVDTADLLNLFQSPDQFRQFIFESNEAFEYELLF